MPGLERPLVLLVLPALFGLLVFFRRTGLLRGPRLPLGQSGQGGRPGDFEALPASWRLAWRLRAFALALGLLALAVAAAGPTRSSRKPVVTGRGTEIILVLDLSPSMAARDFSPDRLRAAKAIIARFLGRLRSETVGLVAFGAESALIVPPTRDYAAVGSRLAALEPGIFGEGTALGTGLAAAAAHLARSKAPERRLVLVTDGENNAGGISPESAAALARRAGARLEVVGIGSEGRAPIVYRDPATGRELKGSYASSFDREALRRLAATGGGEYHDARDEAGLDRAFAAIGESSLGFELGASSVEVERLDAPFLALALAALALARLLGLVAGGSLP